MGLDPSFVATWLPLSKTVSHEGVFINKMNRDELAALVVYLAHQRDELKQLVVDVVSAGAE